MNADTRKNIYTAVSFVFLLMTAVSCRQLFSVGQEKNSSGSSAAASSDTVTVYVSAGTDMARTVVCTEPSVCSYQLFGAESGETQVSLGTWTSLSEAVLTVGTGEWDFTLDAFDSSNSLVLEGTQNNLNVNASGTISFTLCPIESGTGIVNVIVSWPSSYTIDSVVTRFNNDTVSPALSVTGYSVTYSNTSAAAGNIPLVFQLYSGTSLVTTVMEVVRVRKNLTSSSTISLADTDMNSAPSLAPSDFVVVCSGTTTNADTDTVALTWNDTTNNETGFEIDCWDRTADSSEETWDTVDAGISGGSKSYIHTTAVRGHVYQYRIRSYNTFGSSAWTSSSTVTIPCLITYDANGGTGTAMNQQLFYPDTYTTLAACTYTSSDSTYASFAGWSKTKVTPKENLSADFAAGSEYCLANSSITASKTLYAVWTKYTVTGVSLTSSSVKMASDEKWQLTAAVSPDNATDKTVLWTSSDTSLATVDSSGLVTGKAPGSVTITVTTNDGYYHADCTFTVDTFPFKRQFHDGDGTWHAFAVSEDGNFIIVSSYNSYVLTSSDRGSSWTLSSTAAAYDDFSMSADGGLIAAYSDYIYFSTDKGKTWTKAVGAASHNWTDISVSSDGKVIAACYNDGYIITSADSGATWTAKTNEGTKAWNRIRVSEDGSTIIAGTSDSLWLLSDSGESWSQILDDRGGYTVAVSCDCSRIYSSSGKQSFNTGSSWSSTSGCYQIVCSKTGSEAIHFGQAGSWDMAPVCTFNSGSSWESLDRSVSPYENGVALSGDGSLAGYTDGSYIYLWNITDSAGTAGTVSGLTDINLAVVGSTVLSAGASASFTARADVPFTVSGWYLDNKLLSGQTGKSVSLCFMNPGSHTLTVQTKANGLAYSKSFRFKVAGDMLVSVTGGTFNRGTDAVTVSDFYMARYEVTQSLYEAVMGSNPVSSDSSYGYGDSYPVYNISWYDAVAFCNALSKEAEYDEVYTISGNDVSADFTKNGYRLPTESEWEYAARGGINSHNYIYAGSDTAEEVAWYNPVSSLNPVGGKKANELDIYDMSGNAYEWCWDWYGDYPSDTQTNYTGPSSGSSRVIRGGSWMYGSSTCTVSFRNSASPSGASSDIGFRVVRKK